MKLNLGHGVPRNVNIMSFEVPPELDRTVRTGIDFVDEVFGGEGLTPSISCLFSGEPGAGKTTTALQLADSLTRLGHVCLVNTNEEAVVQLRKTVRRLKLKHGFIVGNDRKISDVVEHAKFLQQKVRGKKTKKGEPVQVVVVQDSLQTSDDGKYTNGHTNSKTPQRVIEIFTDWAKTKVAGNYGIAIALGQVTKSGEFAGKESIIHTIDAHLHLRIDNDPSSPSYGGRLIEMRKNRFGSGYAPIPLEIAGDGLRVAMGA